MRKTREFPVAYRDADPRIDCAKEIVPWIIDLLHPKSVADVGCNLGHWLSVFNQHGVEDIVGFDGPWVKTDKILIPADCFYGVDINGDFNINRSFDLVMSLEVAEHIFPEKSENLVEQLTKSGNAVLFSAAIPGQGGCDHYNEQWPDYWIEMFRRNGFEVIDCLRPKFWGNEQVFFYYAQNTFLFIKKDILEADASLKALKDRCDIIPHSIVHPALFARKMEKLRDRTFPGSVIKLANRVKGAIQGKSKNTLKERFVLPPSGNARL